MMMKWYCRALLSYIPMLFVIISSLIFFSFMALTAASEHDYIETNQAILNRIAYQADANLLLIERNVISRLLTDKELQQFFSNQPKTAYDHFHIQQSLIELKAALPFHSSVYVFNQEEQRIMSDGGAYELTEFADRSFVQTKDAQAVPAQWTAPRSLLAYDGSTSQVVSLMKYYEEGGVRRGAIVINVYTDSILEYVNSFNESVTSPIRLLYGDEMDQAASRRGGTEAISYSVAPSEYTGWGYRWEIGQGTSYETLSLAARLWLGLAILIAAASLVGFTLVVHRRPEQLTALVASRIAVWPRGQTGAGTSRIESGMAEYGISAAEGQEPTETEYAALERTDEEEGHALLAPTGKPTDTMRKLSGICTDEEARPAQAPGLQAAEPFVAPVIDEEEVQLRSQRLFHDLLAGHVILTDDQFICRMSQLQLPYAFDRMGVFAAEIDNISPFTEHYSAQGRQLLKYVVEQSLRELAEQHGLFAWQVWMEPHRLACVVHQFRQEPAPLMTAGELAAAWQKWIRQYLQLTLSIGVGADSNSIETIAESYRNAQDNLSLKPVFGVGAWIDNKLGASKSSLDSYAYLQALESVVRSLRLQDEDWQDKLTQWITELRDRRITKQELNMLVHSVVLQVEKELLVLHPNIQQQWKEEFIHRFADLKECVETLDELEKQLAKELTAFARVIEQERELRRHHHLALQAKNYIDLHFTEPSLSLASVSAMLNLRPSALSQIFKEELGIKFVDYVIRIRLDHARRMLAETDEPIQAIAEQSGYPNVISFYRAFKKVLDIPPGEYRSVYRAL
ncbi:helix-turn-helix domain-containing protein [Paenibacillus sp. SYP-B4298]|uniref:helix-turn-helix domain-containing protein n=1 Tax=Paenibacillus sp. SYP-B4298 TaxID=2996034 RepID=UPI0022DE0EB5|nr:helix-turn-helix domain-containing protein [Paenibacillus sp. SYP-B4298]